MTTTDTRTLQLYVTGFISSIILTLLAFLLVTNHIHSDHTTLSRGVLMLVLAGLALVQFVVQMLCFLHLGTETKPRWKLLVFGFMVLVVLILAGGSLWIMNNLDYRMMPSPHDVNNYLDSQDGL